MLVKKNKDKQYEMRDVNNLTFIENEEKKLSFSIHTKRFMGIP